MEKIQFDYLQKREKIKPMNAVNNGPVIPKASQIRENFTAYRAARIPYARTHDAPYFWHHAVDISCIFPDFDADVNDPGSYNFTLTDVYLKNIEKAGTKVFFRLGQSIEHEVKKYYTLPPKDFQKWAVVCEHIIRHYTEGWAEGSHMDIEYWEIWNEPDLDPDDSTDKRTWGGTKAQFFDLYEITAKHLKACFPELKIGGPAIAGNMAWGEDFLAEMQRRKVPMDFFSWHRYGDCPEQFIKRAEIVRNLMDRYGYQNAESILNEWNYVRGWTDEWVYSIEQMIGIKGASFACAVMGACQYAPVDMLMYYDARPGVMNGMFDFNTLKCRKTYYPIAAFGNLADFGTAVSVKEDDSLYGVGAIGEKGYGALFTYYNDDDGKEDRHTVVEFLLPKKQKVSVECYLTNRENDNVMVKKDIYDSEKFSLVLDMKLFDIYYVSIKPI